MKKAVRTFPKAVSTQLSRDHVAQVVWTKHVQRVVQPSTLRPLSTFLKRRPIPPRQFPQRRLRCVHSPLLDGPARAFFQSAAKPIINQPHSSHGKP